MGLKVLIFAWDNRKALQRAYHHFVKHRVVLDDLIDLACQNPKHPQHKEEKSCHTKTVRS